MPSVELTREVFAERFRARFYDPEFDNGRADIDRLLDIAWSAYADDHKSPRTRKAGPGFADPDYDLSLDWLAARGKIKEAEARHADEEAPARILIVNGSSRSDQTCPGEMSKTFRLATLAREMVEKEAGFEVDFLDLSRLASEYGRVIYPCKACVSTAMPLCHWPCSCYPNHALGQVNDWMNEIYPMWVRAHGVMIICPVNWYQAPSSLKLMIDRLVCADGGNPDPTSTHGKDPAAAKAIELAGWDYPRHLKGRLFAIVVHGDASGAENLRRMLADWLTDMGLIRAGNKALLDRYVGYYAPYATSHDDLDRDQDFQDEVRNAARTLIEAVKLQRGGRLPAPDAALHEARPK
jgi:multimeric flavodoxin WrbA